MTRQVVARLVAAALLAILSPTFAARRAHAQGDSVNTRRGTNLGLAAIGAVTAHVGGARIERGFRALAGGLTVDFGHLASPRVRLVTDATYLLTSKRTERVETEGKSFRDNFRDLSGHIALAAHASPAARLSPYVAAGVGVHVLSSSFGSLSIDTRYNSNNFGLLGAAGVRTRLGAGQRRALDLEVRAIQARNVRRVSLHVGLAALFNDLRRP